jgi:SAM-dependent methyltransferase
VHDPGPLAAPYDDDFYRAIGGWAAQSAAAVVPIVDELVAPGSVVDVGCGTGAWLAAWIDHGVADVIGIDGDHVPRSELALPADRFRPADLTRPPVLERSFDLALCLEVAEHLDPDDGDALVAYLVSLAPVVLFSAAIPGQGGVDHVNEQWPGYWARRFARHGYRAADVVRPRIWEDDAVAWFYRQNIVVYAEDDRFDHVVPAFPLVPDDDGDRDRDRTAAPASFVHPELLHAWQDLAVGATADRPEPSVRSLARQAPGALARATGRRVRRGPRTR